MVLGRLNLDYIASESGQLDDIPVIETLTPSYKTYPLVNIASLKTDASQEIVPFEEKELPVPGSIYSCYSRPEGQGLERGYK